MRPVTRQELDSALSRACANIAKNMLQRSDIQSINSQVRSDLLKDLRTLHAENQAAMKQDADGRNHIAQRISGVENNLSRIEQMLQALLQQQSRTSDRVRKMESSTDAGYLFQRM